MLYSSSAVSLHWNPRPTQASTVFALGGILTLCETPEQLHGVGKSAEASTDKVPELREMLRASDVPAAPGRVSAAPGLQDRTEQTLCGQPVHRGSRLVPLVPVRGSVAGGVLVSNPPTAGSAGRNIQTEVGRPIKGNSKRNNFKNSFYV